MLGLGGKIGQDVEITSVSNSNAVLLAAFWEG